MIHFLKSLLIRFINVPADESGYLIIHAIGDIKRMAKGRKSAAEILEDAHRV